MSARHNGAVTERPSLSFHGALAAVIPAGLPSRLAEVGTDLVMCYTAARVRSAWKQIPPPWSKAWQPAWRAAHPAMTDAAAPSRTTWEEAFDEEVAFEADAVLRDAAFFGSERVRCQATGAAANRRRCPSSRRPCATPYMRRSTRRHAWA